MSKVTVIASSVRHHLWPECLDSLKQNDIEMEIIFCGNLDSFQTRPYLKKYDNLQYIHAIVKPAQCYHAAYLNADYESLIVYIADDAEFEPNQIDKTVEFYTSLNNPQAIVSMRTNENGKDYGTDVHTLLGWNVNTPLMAPIGMVNQRFLAELGGFDKRFISGQWENDFVMRAYLAGGDVIPFDPGPSVRIDHTLKHKHDGNPFWTAYVHDRTILENTWVKAGYKSPTPIVQVTLKDGQEIKGFKILDNRKVLKHPVLPFEPYEDVDILTVNQGPAGIWDCSPMKEVAKS